jgi:hypothetical protein
VLGREHPDTLTSVYCLAYLLAKQDCYKESLALYDRACVGHSNVLGDDHPITRACRQHRSEAFILQEQAYVIASQKGEDSGTGVHGSKTSVLSRRVGLATLKMRSSKYKRELEDSTWIVS